MIDLDQHASGTRYETPALLREHLSLRDDGCVFPWCTKKASVCDCDHITPYDADGPTCDCNLALLCRTHHRLKTHTRWRYDHHGHGVHIWRSPHGLLYHRDPSATQAINPNPSRTTTHHTRHQLTTTTPWFRQAQPTGRADGSTGRGGRGFDKPVLSHDEGLNRRDGPWFRQAAPEGRVRRDDRLNRWEERRVQLLGAAGWFRWLASRGRKPRPRVALGPTRRLTNLPQWHRGHREPR